jgi:hypothetical protein
VATIQFGSNRWLKNWNRKTVRLRLIPLAHELKCDIARHLNGDIVDRLLIGRLELDPQAMSSVIIQLLLVNVLIPPPQRRSRIRSCHCVLAVTADCVRVSRWLLEEIKF